MTDKPIRLTQQDITHLFEQGDCLTFDWRHHAPEISQYKSQLRQNFYNKFGSKTKCLVVSKRKELIPTSACFHYFSNGVLLCKANISPKAALRFEKILESKGFKINQRLTNISEISMYEISDFATQHCSPRDDLIVIPYPSKEEFAQKLFMNGNICLTASKFEDINPECRQYMALFADGKWIVSNEYSFLTGTHDLMKVVAFQEKNPEYVYLELELVPPEYIDYIYQKAGEFDWYISPEAALEKYQSSHPARHSFLSTEELQFVDNLIRDNKCLSLLSPSPELSPDWLKYALFADGRLIVDDSKTMQRQNYLASELGRIYPELKIKIEPKPVYLVEKIYETLLRCQKSARSIYIEIMKQKARKLKKMLNIPHYEALELTSKMAGWQNWKEITQIDEAKARFVILVEKHKKESAQKANKDLVRNEYERYNFLHSSKKKISS